MSRPRGTVRRAAWALLATAVGVVLGATPAGATSTTRAPGGTAVSVLAQPVRDPLVVAVVPDAPVYADGSARAGQHRSVAASVVVGGTPDTPSRRPPCPRVETPAWAESDVRSVRAARAPPRRAR